jgi:MFS transporter, ACDE family, multidrug resistance protein
VIIGAASGGFAGAIILYETALGIGIALGPLVGGELGGISWRGPFFGVSVLMTISLVATLLFVERTPRPPRKTSITEPLRALRHRALAIMSITALGYNWGFFTLLAYTPFPMHLGIHELGYVFTGWGIMVAIFAVFVAQRLQARFGTARTLYVNLALMSADLLVIAVFTSSQLALIVAVIVSGAFVGLNNTLTTQAVMLVAPVDKPVASAAYGFVRFIGGGLAPFVASKLAADLNVHVPFYLGAPRSRRRSGCWPPAIRCWTGPSTVARTLPCPRGRRKPWPPTRRKRCRRHARALKGRPRPAAAITAD